MTSLEGRNSKSRQIVIIGGGVIGSCTAYYLTRHPLYDPKIHTITILEATRIAGGASGKAGGCIARWADPACISPASFDLHETLATEHDGTKLWGYRRVSCADCDAVESSPEGASLLTPIPKDIDWVDRSKIKLYDPLGDTTNSSQVHPYLFTTVMSQLAEEKGARIIIGSAQSIDYTQGKKGVQSVTFKDHESGKEQQLLATDIIVSAGPWTRTVLPEAPVGGEKSHSIVINPKRTVSPNVLFFDPGRVDEDDKDNQLEIYPRPDRTVYVCGQTDYNLELPNTTDDVVPDPGRCEKIWDTLGLVSDDLRQGDILIKQACFRPMVHAGDRDVELGPLLGFTGVEGLILSAGHNQWGIQNAPISGKVVSELVFEGKAVSADISKLDPREYINFI